MSQNYIKLAIQLQNELGDSLLNKELFQTSSLIKLIKLLLIHAN